MLHRTHKKEEEPLNSSSFLRIFLLVPVRRMVNCILDGFRMIRIHLV